MEFFLTATVLKLIPFLRVTILIAFTSMALGLIFGTLLAAMKMCRIKMLKTIANPVYNIYQVYAGDWYNEIFSPIMVCRSFLDWRALISMVSAKLCFQS